MSTRSGKSPTTAEVLGLRPPSPDVSKLGITGTKDGPTVDQQKVLVDLIREYFTPGAEFHHGDCVGVDAFGAVVADAAGYFTVAHPPERSTHRAFVDSHEVREVKPYLDRDHDIAEGVDLLLVVPKGRVMEVRSGTWATYRYAAKARRRTIIIWPDGTTTVEMRG